MMLIRNMILISLAIAVCAVPDAPDDIVPENMPEEKFYDQAVEQEFTNEKSSNDATRSELEVNDIVRPSSESSVLQEITSEFPKASFEEITNKVSEEITCQPGTYVKMEEPRPSMGRYGDRGGRRGRGGPSSHMCRYIKMRDPGCCDGGQGRMCDYARREGCCPKEEAKPTKTCRGCGSGKYAAGTDAAECLECAVGTFSSGNKAASCEDCPIGKSSPEGKPGSYWCLADQCIAAQGTCTFDSSTPGALQDGGCCSGKCNERGYCCKGMWECPPPTPGGLPTKSPTNPGGDHHRRRAPNPYQFQNMDGGYQTHFGQNRDGGFQGWKDGVYHRAG